MRSKSIATLAASCLISLSAAQAGPVPLRPKGRPAVDLLACTAPSGAGARVTVADADNCATTGLRISWTANPSNWGDSGVGTRSYDLIRNSDGRRLTFAYGTNSYMETPPQAGTECSYTLIYRNGCGMTRTTSSSGGDYDFRAPAAPPPTSPFPTDGGSLCRSPHPALEWSVGSYRADVLVDGEVVCDTANAPCVVPGLTDGPHTWQVVSKNVCDVPTEGPVWSFEVKVANETCDDHDNDCDGEIDEDLSRPCETGCASGTESCVLGQWLSCSARPCCDVTVGPDQPDSTLCPAAETPSSTVCVQPGTYSVPAGCNVRSSLVGTGDRAATIIDGDLTLKQIQARVQGLTITGAVLSEVAIDLLENRVLGGVRLNNPDEARVDAGPVQMAHNEIHQGLLVSFPSFVHANEITGGLALDADDWGSQAAVGNRISGGGMQVIDSRTAYVARNVIEGANAGIAIPCDAWRALIVGNTVAARGNGIRACSRDYGGGVSVLRNDIVYGGEIGVDIVSDILRIEGNKIVRDTTASPTPVSTGVFAHVLSSDTEHLRRGSLRDNTIVGGTFGVNVVQERGSEPVVIGGNVVVGSADTGVLVCEPEICPASPTLAVEATHNDVFSSPILWAGLDDPTGVMGNISADPLFVDPAAGDFALGSGSPCRDAGATAFMVVDLAGQSRTQDGDGDGLAVADMGAMESETEVCTDEDGDGFGSPGSASCPAGRAKDCDDANSAVHPGGVELPGNSIDENCDGSAGACDPDRADGWRNHGQFVRCVAHEVAVLVEGGLISTEVGNQLIANAARSGVGK